MALAHGSIGWWKIAGLGVALVVAGQFSGWNYGLAIGGWANMAVATVLMAILCFGLALCVAELTAAQPSAGGLYVYCEEAFGSFAGYIVGFAVFAALAIGTGAAAEFISIYSIHVIGFGGWPLKLAIFGTVIALHIRGVGEAMRWMVVAGALSIFCILIFDVTMLPHFRFANLAMPGTSLVLDMPGVFSCIPFAIWLFISVEQTAAASEEVSNPARNMPRGIMAAVAILLLTAFSILLLAAGGGGIGAVGSAGDPLFAAMTSPLILEPQGWIASIVGSGGILGLIATMFSLIYSASRQLFALSRDRHIPALLGRTNSAGAPWVALMLVGAIGIGTSTMRPDRILLAVVLALSGSYVILLAAFIRLRVAKPALHRPFRVWNGVAIAGVCLLLAATVFIACFQVDRAVLIGLMVLFGAATLTFLATRRTARVTITPIERSNDVR